MTPVEESAVLKQLQALYELLKNPSAWIKGDLARDAERVSVPYASPRAVCFCLVGGLCYINADYAVEQVLYRTLHGLHSGHCRSTGLATFNDHPETTHADVLALIASAMNRVSNINTEPTL